MFFPLLLHSPQKMSQSMFPNNECHEFSVSGTIIDSVLRGFFAVLYEVLFGESMPFDLVDELSYW